METKNYTVTEEFNEFRLDKYLSSVSGFSRNQVQKLIEGGFVSVTHGYADISRKVKTDERIVINIPYTKTSENTPQDIPVDIIYQDKFLAVINKPRGIAVHPGAGRDSGTLVNALLYHIKDLSGIGGIERPGIVHRLDIDTSGIILIAKNNTAHENISAQFANRTIEKTYFAIVHGKAKKQKGEIIAPIGRHKINRKKMAVIESGRYAHTLWETEEIFDDFSFLKINIMTGRTHQIRVHMAYINHPIAGDPLYCNKQNLFGAKRQLLHAGNISFFHPQDGKKLVFSAPIPEDMLAALKILRN